jgi:GNAT superfamily N-acetyltransferase
MPDLTSPPQCAWSRVRAYRRSTASKIPLSSPCPCCEYHYVARNFGDSDVNNAGRTVIVARSVSDAVVKELLAGYLAELVERIPDFDPETADPPGRDDFEEPAGVFLIALVGGESAGCGALRNIGQGIGELRRMWVRPAFRGRGLGRRLLESLETRARSLGLVEARLDTNDELREALSLYRSAGYEPIAQYNHNAQADHWLAKALP